MSDRELGEVEMVNLETVWPHEALDFTPWLAENLHLLGEALNMNLKLTQPEARVGPYYLDILAKEVDRNITVAIENQYGTTDITHLGQLLIYAAGCDARIAIWVAPEFGYEHAQALHRLNEWTRDGIDFYGVKVEVLKIGDSLPAPVFRQVVHPGGWNKDITLQSGAMSAVARKFHDFFQPLIGGLMQSRFADKAVQHYDYTGRFFPSRVHSDIGYAASFWKNAAWVTLHIQTEDKERTKQIFDLLKEDCAQIQKSIEGEDWRWHRYDKNSFSSINLMRYGCSIDDPPKKHDEIRAWMIDNLRRLKEVMDPRLEKILTEETRER